MIHGNIARCRKSVSLSLLLGYLINCAQVDADVLNPYPSPPAVDRPLATFTFRGTLKGWNPHQQLRGVRNQEFLAMQSMGNDPFLFSPLIRTARRGGVLVSIRMRTTADGPLQIFWISEQHRDTAEQRSASVPIVSDGQWHDYSVKLNVDGKIRQIRLDPVRGPGPVEIDKIWIRQHVDHPLEIQSVDVAETNVTAWVQNRSTRAIAVRLDKHQQRLEPRTLKQITVPRLSPGVRFFEPYTFSVKVSGAPALSRISCLINTSAAEPKWESLEDGPVRLDVAADGTGARLSFRNRVVAYLSPLAWQPGKISDFRVTKAGGLITCSGGAVQRLEFSLQDGVVRYRLSAGQMVEGPVVRAIGQLEQGLLAGVEHLGRGERSSSSIDLHVPEHVRFAPEPMLVTMPLMAYVTDRGAVALTWSDMTLQPTFATPNFFDGTSDHRMALQGQTIHAAIRIGRSYEEGECLKDAIVWAVQEQGGFPPLPDTGRSHPQQMALSSKAFTKTEIKSPSGGWFHAIVPGKQTLPEKPQFFADVASTLYRLNGNISSQARFVRGGAHISNDTAFFVTSRVPMWQQQLSHQVENVLQEQQADGSFRYHGELQKGHFEDTASGYCADRAYKLLYSARLTGDQRVLKAALKTLEYMKRFRTPRGAQTWECPLHAPDQHASTWMVKSYVYGYELTGNQEYLDLAVRWAISGIPNVYQWSSRPIMLYASTPTLCASHFRGPVWIGRPVQWVGMVYADALLDLSRHDDTLNWRHLAECILRSAEQQQYTQGPSIGCLPDSVTLKDQRRFAFDIHPATLISVRLRFQGLPAGLAVAASKQHRIASPFPVKIVGDKAHIEGQTGQRYQVLINGTRIKDVQSQGEDVVSLN